MFVPTSITIRQARRLFGLTLLLAAAAVCGKNARTQQVEKNTTGKPADTSDLASAEQVPAKAPGAEAAIKTAKKTNAGPRLTPRRTIRAHVVAIDQPYLWNRLGASQPNAMVYALARDVVPTDYDPYTGKTPRRSRSTRPARSASAKTSGLGPSCSRRRGRPARSDLHNLLAPKPSASTASTASETRYAGFHVMGLELYDSIDSDSSWVGVNPPVKPSETQPNPVDPINQPGGIPGSVCAPGETKVYTYYAKAEGTFLVHSFSDDMPLPNLYSHIQTGLFGVVNVQPEAAEFYRSQVTRQALYQATYYIEESHEKKLDALYELMMNRPSAMRRGEALKTPVYLPEQPGVYILEPSKTTNMRLVPVFDEGGERRHVHLFGRKFPVFTLTTVVPSPVNRPSRSGPRKRPPADHPFRLDTDRNDLAGIGIECHHRRLIQRDPPPADVHQGVRGTEVDRHVTAEERQHAAHDKRAF